MDLARHLRREGIFIDAIAELDARHVDRPVFTGELDGQPVVLKHYSGPHANASAQVAHEVATALWTSSFGATREPPGLPRPVVLAAATGVAVAERLDGPMLGARGDLGGALTHAAEAAHLLADLHTVWLQPLDGITIRERSMSALIRSLRRKVADLEHPDMAEVAEVAEVAATVVDRIERDAPPTAVLVPTHGDFTPRNLVVTPRGLRMLDLDRVRLAAPDRDVGYWRAWCWATQLLAGDEPSWTATEPFVDAYHACLPPRVGASDGSSPHYVAAALLRIVHGWSALRSRPDLQLVLAREALAAVADPMSRRSLIDVSSS
ncbi:MAG TPA: phosphotransferase [Ilumatobacteraceae bacterium]|nr:phosphotransferase [Ilumatobacteraceae bacterium]